MAHEPMVHECHESWVMSKSHESEPCKSFSFLTLALTSPSPIGPLAHTELAIFLYTTQGPPIKTFMINYSSWIVGMTQQCDYVYCKATSWSGKADTCHTTRTNKHTNMHLTAPSPPSNLNKTMKAIDNETMTINTNNQPMNFCTG